MTPLCKQICFLIEGFVLSLVQNKFSRFIYFIMIVIIQNMAIVVQLAPPTKVLNVVYCIFLKLILAVLTTIYIRLHISRIDLASNRE